MTITENRVVTVRYAIGIAFVAWLVLSAMSWFFADRTLDDAWITFRYARHMAEGAGLRWNVDDALPFEAYTSFTHVLFAAACERLQVDPVTASKALGTVLNLLLLLLLAWHVRREGGGRGEMVVGAAALGGSVFMAFHAVAGMETPIYLFVIALATFAFYRALHDPAWLPALFGVFVLGVLTRPDCGLLFGCYYLIMGYVHRAHWKGFVWWSAGLLAVPALAYVGFKWAYFGSVLPNSFHFKVGPSGAAILPGLVYVRDFVLWSLPALGVWGLVLLAKRRFVPAELFALAAVALAVAFYMKVTPRVGVGFRFVVPYTSAIVFLLLPPLIRWFRSLAGSERRAWTAILLVLIVANHAMVAGKWAPEIHRYMTPRVVNPALGKALAGMEDAESITLVTGEAGAVPYYSRMRHLDFLGLVHPAGAASPFDPYWVFDQQIDVLITHSVAVDMLPGGDFRPDPALLAQHVALRRNATETLSYKLLAHPAMSDFALLAKIPYRRNPAPHEYYLVLANRNSPHYAEIAERVDGLSVPLD